MSAGTIHIADVSANIRGRQAAGRTPPTVASATVARPPAASPWTARPSTYTHIAGAAADTTPPATYARANSASTRAGPSRSARGPETGIVTKTVAALAAIAAAYHDRPPRAGATVGSSVAVRKTCIAASSSTSSRPSATCPRRVKASSRQPSAGAGGAASCWTVMDSVGTVAPSRRSQAPNDRRPVRPSVHRPLDRLEDVRCQPPSCTDTHTVGAARPGLDPSPGG